MTIQQLAAATGISKHTLRYYERVGLVPRVGRDPSSGHRRYREEHIGWLQFLRDLRSTGMPIRDVRAYVRLIERGDASWPRRRALLAAHRKRVAASIQMLKRHRDVLDKKLALGCAPHAR
jgi:DNA-binding transcriptional MerR regulator